VAARITGAIAVFIVPVAATAVTIVITAMSVAATAVTVAVPIIAGTRSELSAMAQIPRQGTCRDLDGVALVTNGDFITGTRSEFGSMA
jgi:hypothetical protein